MGLFHSQSSSSPLKMNMGNSITDQTDLSFLLAKHVFSREITGDSNLVFSPLSIQLVLSLVAAGSKGPTQNQLLCFLKSKSINDLNSLYSHLVDIIFVDGSSGGGPRLSVANGVWIDRSLSLKPFFKQVVDKVYKATSMQKAFTMEHQNSNLFGEGTFLLCINIDKNTEKDLQLAVEAASKRLVDEKLEVVDFTSHVNVSADIKQKLQL
ncbi:PREDICTED: serpin-ZX-like [Nicotiana attenuata]|uniref:serpin-ZX-like n=1 Tax=Nicotiana attenuata TaxID=49451 RepID=UPI000904AAF3|nr:PREDICTED: serpin-ZX-like [Nicotiana attenuata]